MGHLKGKKCVKGLYAIIYTGTAKNGEENTPCTRKAQLSATEFPSSLLIIIMIITNIKGYSFIHLFTICQDFEHN